MNDEISRPTWKQQKALLHSQRKKNILRRTKHEKCIWKLVLTPTKATKEIMEKAKSKLGRENTSWRKPMWPTNADVDKKKTHQWLHYSELKAETERFILAEQDESLLTRNYRANILKNKGHPRWCTCTQYDEWMTQC